MRHGFSKLRGCLDLAQQQPYGVSVQQYHQVFGQCTHPCTTWCIPTSFHQPEVVSIVICRCPKESHRMIYNNNIYNMKLLIYEDWKNSASAKDGLTPQQEIKFHYEMYEFARAIETFLKNSDKPAFHNYFQKGLSLFHRFAH